MDFEEFLNQKVRGWKEEWQRLTAKAENMQKNKNQRERAMRIALGAREAQGHYAAYQEMLSFIKNQGICPNLKIAPKIQFIPFGCPGSIVRHEVQCQEWSFNQPCPKPKDQWTVTPECWSVNK